MKRCLRVSILSWLIIVLLALGAKDSPLAGDSDILEATDGDELIQIDLLGSFNWSDSAVVDFGIIGSRASVVVPGAVWVLDVSNPALPVSDGYYPLEMDLTYASKGIGFITSYYSNCGENTILSIYDITDPSTPVPGFIMRFAPIYALWGYGTLEMKGEGCGCGTGMGCWASTFPPYDCMCMGSCYLLDLTDLQPMSILDQLDGSCPDATSAWPPMCITTERIYNLWSGFNIYDKSRTLLGSCDLPGSPSFVAESGTKAYAVDDSVLHIIDVFDATAPMHEATYDLPPSTEVIHYADGYVYLTGGSSDVQIIDLLEPSTVGYWDSPGDSVIAIQVVGDITWVGDETGLYALHTTLQSCCGRFNSGFTGNTDCSLNGAVTLSDVARLIDHVFISKLPLCCGANGNVNGSSDGVVNLSDISRLIDHIYISKSETAVCH